MDPFPVGIFEVIADLGEFFASAGDDLGVCGLWEELGGESEADGGR